MKAEINLVSFPKKSFWKLSIPIIAFCIFDAIYGIVDMVWVSKIGVEAFFAMGVSIPFVSLIFSFGDSVGQGTNSMMSRFIGSGDYESSYNTLIHGLIVSHIIWVLLVICLFFAHGILFYLNQADSYILVFDYLVPIVIFSYLFIFVNLFCETLQAEGNSRTPTILIIASNILNIILDPIFIFNFNLGIKGAAYATVLSALPVFLYFIFVYLSGRTKVPLSLKYFKFRPYILVEIVKVALPNFLDNGLWAFSASFINSILIATTGEMGPILYSTANKLKTLFIAPVRGYGRGLMSITGHLFGAHKFDDLNYMFKYILKISLVTTFVIMTVFIFIRDYVFGLFSITGMENELFLLTICGTITMLTIPISMISSKMLDGFGKSMYSLLFTFLKIMFEVILIYGLYILLNDGVCVLIGIMVSEIIFGVVYYLFLEHLFRNFNDEFDGKSTVKIFDEDEESLDDSKEKISHIDEGKNNGKFSKIPLILALIALTALFLQIVSIPLRNHDYPMLIWGAIAFIIGGISVYLMEELNRPILSICGFLIGAVLIFVFMGEFSYIPTILFILAGLSLASIKRIVKLLSSI